MFRFVKTSFFWQFAGGFLIGAAGLLALHPVEAADARTDAPAAFVQR